MRKYTNGTPKEERKSEEVEHAMRDGAKERTKTLMVKMEKLLAVASPANGLEFLPEVRDTLNVFQKFGFLHYVSTI